MQEERYLDVSTLRNSQYYEERGPNSMKKRKVIALALLVVTLFGVSAGLIGRYLYCGFILQRPEHFTTFEPFSGKLFDIDPEEVSVIAIRNAQSPTDTPAATYFEDEEHIKEFTEFFNSFRYCFWWPGPDERHIGQAFCGTATIKLKNLVFIERAHKYFPESALFSLDCKKHRIWFRNAWYYYRDEEFFEKFNELK